MKRFDLRKIRHQLAFGDLTRIADELGISADIVSAVLNHGWHPDHRNDVVAAALDIIKAKDENPEILKEADSMKLAADTFTSMPHRPHHKFQKGNKDYKKKGVGNKGLLLVLGAVLLFALFGKKLITKLQ